MGWEELRTRKTLGVKPMIRKRILLLCNTVWRLILFFFYIWECLKLLIYVPDSKTRTVFIMSVPLQSLYSLRLISFDKSKRTSSRTSLRRILMAAKRMSRILIRLTNLFGFRFSSHIHVRIKRVYRTQGNANNEFRTVGWSAPRG